MTRMILRFAAAGIVCASLTTATSASSDGFSILKSLLPDKWTQQSDPTVESARETANRWVEETVTQIQERIEQIRSGDNLASVLDRNGVPVTEAAGALQALREVY